MWFERAHSALRDECARVRDNEATISTGTPFVTAVATKDGSMIYAMTGEHGTILAIDPIAQRELRAMPVGRAPSLALIAP